MIRLARIALAMVLAAVTGGAFADTGPAPSEEHLIRAYKDTAEASVIRGSAVYKTYCQLCHGAEGEGNGRAARLYTPKPANLTRSRVPDEYREMMIRKGGEGVGRSKFMPPWGEQLTDEQISDVITFLGSIRRDD